MLPRLADYEAGVTLFREVFEDRVFSNHEAVNALAATIWDAAEITNILFTEARRPGGRIRTTGDSLERGFLFQFTTTISA